MSEKSFPPFIKWSQYKSTDPANPDTLHLKVVETEPFETKFSINVRVQIRMDNELHEAILVLKSKESNNADLYKKWLGYVKEGKIKPEVEFRLQTWLGKSTVLNRPIRRFTLVF